MSQAFASRTYAELAAVTANLPAEPTAAQPPRPARTPDEIMQRPGRMMAVATALYAGVWAFVWLLPWPRNSEPACRHDRQQSGSGEGLDRGSSAVGATAPDSHDPSC